MRFINDKLFCNTVFIQVTFFNAIEALPPSRTTQKFKHIRLKLPYLQIWY